MKKQSKLKAIEAAKDKEDAELLKKHSAVVERFKDEVCLREPPLDPQSEYDWSSLSLGFFLACGLTPDDAYMLSSVVRYKCGYWQP